MRRGRTLAAIAAAWLAGLLPVPGQAQSRTPVDLELVLAVDVSNSMDVEEQQLQREGYAAAFRDPAVQAAIASGGQGRIAVSYLEWAGYPHQRVLVDWTLIDGPEAAERFADTLAEQPISRVRRTSVSGGLEASARLFGTRFEGLRRVIDISGDGMNNEGPPVLAARDRVLAEGITINGLPLTFRQGYGFGSSSGGLDLYYEDCVIGGPGAFVIAVERVDQFAQAIRDKLILEISGLGQAPRLMPATSTVRPSCDSSERRFEN